MIAYGDRTVVRAPGAAIDSLRAGLAALESAGPGLDRHSALSSLLLAAGELAQWLADRAFDDRGCDDRDRPADLAMNLAVALARQVWRSHRSGYATAVSCREARAALWRLVRGAGDAGPLNIRSPEGFHHYAVYPETFGAAAAGLEPEEPGLILGIRTIGATLAAMVAGVFRSRRRPLTVRPVGHPFERRLDLGPGLARELGRRRGPVAVVDEGPGLSGSSFGAALDALARAGVAESRVHLFPSHHALGPRASPGTRIRWERVARRCVSFEAELLGDGPTGLVAWTSDLTGAQTSPPEDISAGRWRAHLFDDPARWPPAAAVRERRKYLLRAGGGRFLARFAGLGAAGEACQARGRLLAEAGFSPPVLGLRHGFLVQPWVDQARPLGDLPTDPPRQELLARVADYLAFRTASFPAGPGRGAGPHALLATAIANASEVLDKDAVRRLERFVPWLEDLARQARPVEVDARMHAWEWLRLPDGRLLKTDAVDHCDGHDPIGCQDSTWDVAGAAVELALDSGETQSLRRRLRSNGAPIEPEQLTFYRACYLGFQLGLYHLAGQTAGESSEAARLEAAASRYARQLASA